MATKTQNNLIAGGLLAVIAGGFWVMSDQAEQSRPPSAPPVSGPPMRAAPADPDDLLRGAASRAIPRAKDATRARLKDPDSARFKDVYAVKTPAGGLLVCGNVNSKNSFGGYVGFSPFMWTPSGLVILLEDMKKQEFAKAWNASCVKWDTIYTARD